MMPTLVSDSSCLSVHDLVFFFFDDIGLLFSLEEDLREVLTQLKDVIAVP